MIIITVQLRHLEHLVLTQNDDRAGRVQPPSACPTRHLDVLGRSQGSELFAVVLLDVVKDHRPGWHVDTWTRTILTTDNTFGQIQTCMEHK